MSTGHALALLGSLATLAFAAHMLWRPHFYLGSGTAPISDPRVIRGFGLFLILLAVALFLGGFATAAGVTA